MMTTRKNFVRAESDTCGARDRRSALRSRPVVNAVMLTLFGLGLVACTRAELMNDYDPASGASKKDYEGLVGRRGQDAADAEAAKGGEPPIPDFQSVLAAPSAPELADTRRVSIAVTETTPIRDILIELARKAEVDLELDPRISGGVIMTATDRPFIEVIDRLSNLAELRYSFERNILKVEIDDPYLEQYRMDVLNQTRNSQTQISSSTDASSAAQAIGGTAGGNNASSASIDSESTSDFWGTISQNVDQILKSIQSRRGAAADAIRLSDIDDEASADVAQPSTPPADPLAAIAAQSGAETETSADAAASLNTSGDARGGGIAAASNFSVNAQAGLITVFANQRQQKAIEKYLRAVRSSVTQQVLIEAKILEIELSDQYRSGINWQAFLGPGIFDATGARIGENLSLTTNFSRDVVPADLPTRPSPQPSGTPITTSTSPHSLSSALVP